MTTPRPTFMATVADLLGAGGTFDELLDRVPFNLIVDRSEGGVVYANQTQLHSFNMTWEEFRGYGWARAVHPADAPLFERAANDFLNGKTDRFELKYRVCRPPDGEIIWIHAYVHAIRDGTGAHVGNVGTSFDVTDQMLLHERVAHTQRMEAVGRLSGRIAHDFNNLLGVLLACIDTVGHETPGVGTETLLIMSEAVERARQITDQLLVLAQSRAAKPSSLLDEELRRLAPLVTRTIGARIGYEVSLGSGHAAVALDPGQIGQIMLNLVSNARDAIAESGRVFVSTELQQDQVRWVVEDDGGGMDEAVARRATEAFFTTKSPDRGTGLGLSTAADLVRNAGGTVAIDSAPGRGTRIVMTLPQVSGPIVVTPRPLTSVEASAGQGTLLLVEDHDALRQSLALVLSTHGYRVLSAGSVREALSAAQGHPEIAALVTDLNLPDGDGAGCAEILRRERPGMAVVYTSGLAFGPPGELTVREAFLKKPVSPRELVRVLQSLIREAGSKHVP